MVAAIAAFVVLGLSATSFGAWLIPFGKHNMTTSHLFNLEILKYPRTPHLRGSRLQVGDQADAVSYEALAGRHIVVEESSMAPMRR